MNTDKLLTKAGLVGLKTGLRIIQNAKSLEEAKLIISGVIADEEKKQ